MGLFDEDRQDWRVLFGAVSSAGCHSIFVMAVLVTAIHVLFPRLGESWMPGTSPGMTSW
jgi:hypothetical protein